MITSTAQSVPNSGRSFSRRARPDDLGLAQSVEDLAVEQLIAKAGVEALDVAVLPRAAPLDVSGLGTDNRDPFLHGLGDELRSVVGPDDDPRALELDGPGGVLHATVVADDEVVFVTSANLTEAAFDRNIELGLLVRDRAIGLECIEPLSWID